MKSCFSLTPNGLVFISNQNEFRFKLLFETNEEKTRQIKDSRQFGDGPWPWTGFSKHPAGYVTDRNQEKYFFTSLDVKNYPGWKIISLRNYKNIESLLSEPFFRVIGPAITSILLLTGILVLILYHLGIKEITKRKKAEKELRFSEERYRHIYHKTPVMLHSIDTEGTIIHVSDHWVEVMGSEMKTKR